MVYTFSRSSTVGNLPLRPLIRRTVRGRDETVKTDRQDKYILEIREYPADYKHNRLVPFVTIRDVKQLIGKGKQQAVSVPVPVCENLLQAFLQIREDDGSYNVEKLGAQSFVCDVTRREVEIEIVDGSRRLRSYMEFPSKSYYQEGDTQAQEVIELRKELMPQLAQFLADVIVRYREIKGDMHIPSLYSASGERRFFFDLRDTRWGKRVHISQVTEHHRNVIGIPLETLVNFRDRLNQAIEFLSLEDGTGGAQSPTSLMSSLASMRLMDKKKRKARRRGDRPASSDSEKAGQTPDSDKTLSEEEENSLGKKERAASPKENAQTQTLTMDDSVAVKPAAGGDTVAINGDSEVD